MAARFRFVIEDKAYLCRRVDIGLRVWVAVLAFLAFMALAVALAVALVVYTPLRAFVPGTMTEPERKASIQDLIRLDSLQRAVDVNQEYINSLAAILDPDAEPRDSVIWAARDVTAPTDSLLPKSRNEREFARKLQEKDRYNLSVYEGVDAEGLLFEMPAPGAVFATDANDQLRAKVLLPANALVRAVADGRVVDAHPSPSGGFSISLQHHDGFLTRYSSIGFPIVAEGDEVASGEALAPLFSGAGKTPNVIEIEIWRNGKPLLPYNILTGKY